MEPKLFVSLYTDEDVTTRLVRILRSRGFDARSYQEVGMVTRRDAEHFRYAIDHECAIMTRNIEEFEVLAREWTENGREHSGVIMASQRMQFSELLRRTLAFLNTISADNAIDRVFYLSNFG